MTNPTTLLVLVTLLGSERFKVREAAQEQLTRIVLADDDSSLVERFVNHRDPEVASRCRQVLATYRNIPTPEGLSRWDYFDDYLASQRDALWGEAWTRCEDENDFTQTYITVLFEAGWGRKRILSHIERARLRRRCNQAEAALEQAWWQLRWNLSQSNRFPFRLIPYSWLFPENYMGVAP